MRVKDINVVQSCSTLCNPMNYTVHGILQARILQRVAIPFSRGSSWLRNQTGVSCIADRFFTSWSTREAPKSKRKSFSSSQKLRELTANRPSLKEALKDEFQAERRQSHVDTLTKRTMETSLVVQWLRICLPMQKTQVQSLLREDSTCCGATKPVCHDYWRLCSITGETTAVRSLCTATKTQYSQKF